MEIKHITEEEARQITKTGEPIGLFYKTGLTVYGETMYIGIDNLTGQAGIRAFKTETDCVEWLRTLDRKGANMEIKKISQEMAQKIIDTGEPRGLFYRIEVEEKALFVGIDNSTGDAWTEAFLTEEACINWLNREGMTLTEALRVLKEKIKDDGIQIGEAMKNLFKASGLKSKSATEILDSGERTEFETGAVRDMHGGKGRYDLIPWDAIHELAIHCEQGALKYGERNAELGIPIHSFIDSAIRHLSCYLRGMDEEPHLRSALWNVAFAIWTEKNRPELQDIPARKKGE